mmetsp:Transcript_50075/g.108524  ORF Transcript_50075/g.108524 Transcript_50075/m.108524 type:complete len:80 (-) Transcript_50075:623-862(-)
MHHFRFLVEGGSCRADLSWEGARAYEPNGISLQPSEAREESDRPLANSCRLRVQKQGFTNRNCALNLAAHDARCEAEGF